MVCEKQLDSQLSRNCTNPLRNPSSLEQIVKAGASNTQLNSQRALREFLNAGTTKPSSQGADGQFNQPNELTERQTNGELLTNDRIESGIDWLQFVGIATEGQFHGLVDIVGKLTGDKLMMRWEKSTTTGFKQWKHSGRSETGIKLAWNSPQEGGGIECFISVPGGVLSKMPIRKIRDLAVAAVMVGLHCTRIDAKLDDYGKRIEPIEVIAAIAAKNIAKFEEKDLHTRFDKGWTLYLGSKNSERRTKYYNKEAESKGEIKSYRWETSFRGKTGHKVLMQWLKIDPDELGERAWENQSSQFLARSVVGSIDFRNRQSKPNEKNLSRIPRLDWWQAFIDLVGQGIYHTRPVIKTCLERATGWMTRQVFRSFVSVLISLGEHGTDWLRARLDEAYSSLNAIHWNRIAQFEAEFKTYAYTARKESFV